MRARGWLWIVALLAAGCSAAADVPAPREIRAGVDACAYCHMSVDDPARAAEWVERGGRVTTFDEPGCMVAWLEARPDAEGAGFVADELGGGWVAVQEASFVRGGARTSMGFGVLAYRDRSSAEAAVVERGGEVMTWDELLREGVKDAHMH